MNWEGTRSIFIRFPAATINTGEATLLVLLLRNSRDIKSRPLQLTLPKTLLNGTLQHRKIIPSHRNLLMVGRKVVDQ